MSDPGAPPAGQQAQNNSTRDLDEAVTALECAALALPRHKAGAEETADHLMRLFKGGWSGWSSTQAAGWLDALSALTRLDGVSDKLVDGGVLAAMALFAGRRTAKMDSHNLVSLAAAFGAPGP